MFAQVFQGGSNGVEIFSPSGGDPFKILQLFNEPAIVRSYDRNIKGYMVSMEQESTVTKIQCPKKNANPLGIIQPILCLQLQFIDNKSFSLECAIIDDQNQRRRLHFSTSFRELDSNALHARIPWSKDYSVFEGNWVTVCINLMEICKKCFKSGNYKSLESFIIHPACRIRKIFTLPLQSLDSAPLVTIPTTLDYPIGVPSSVFIYELPDTSKANTSAKSNALNTVGPVSITGKKVESSLMLVGSSAGMNKANTISSSIASTSSTISGSKPSNTGKGSKATTNASNSTITKTNITAVGTNAVPPTNKIIGKIPRINFKQDPPPPPVTINTTMQIIQEGIDHTVTPPPQPTAMATRSFNTSNSSSSGSQGTTQVKPIALATTATLQPPVHVEIGTGPSSNNSGNSWMSGMKSHNHHNIVSIPEEDDHENNENEEEEQQEILPRRRPSYGTTTTIATATNSVAIPSNLPTPHHDERIKSNNAAAIKISASLAATLPFHNHNQLRYVADEDRVIEDEKVPFEPEVELSDEEASALFVTAEETTKDAQLQHQQGEEDQESRHNRGYDDHRKVANVTAMNVINRNVANNVVGMNSMITSFEFVTPNIASKLSSPVNMTTTTLTPNYTKPQSPAFAASSSVTPHINTSNNQSHIHIATPPPAEEDEEEDHHHQVALSVEEEEEEEENHNIPMNILPRPLTSEPFILQPTTPQPQHLAYEPLPYYANSSNHNDNDAAAQAEEDDEEEMMLQYQQQAEAKAEQIDQLTSQLSNWHDGLTNGLHHSNKFSLNEKHRMASEIDELMVNLMSLERKFVEEYGCDSYVQEIGPLTM